MKIHPKVIAAFIAGVIGTLGGALLKVHDLPSLTVAQQGIATTVLSFLAGYLTPAQRAEITELKADVPTFVAKLDEAKAAIAPLAPLAPKPLAAEWDALEARLRNLEAEVRGFLDKPCVPAPTPQADVGQVAPVNLPAVATITVSAPTTTDVPTEQPPAAPGGAA